MEISVLKHPQVRGLFEQALGAPLSTTEAAADLLRQEVTARGRCAKHLLVARVCRLAAPAMLLEPEDVADLCDDLEREGDVVVGEGGIVYPAPSRVISLGDGTHRFVCAIPSVRLRALFEGEWTHRGVRRDCCLRGTAENAARALGGIVLTPEAWAGFDRVPPADGEWIEALDARLAHAPEPLGSLERDEALEWRGLALDPQGPRWMRTESARLWRARHRWAGWFHAWSAGASPSVGPFVKLRADDGARTTYAFGRSSEHPLQARLSTGAGEATLTLPAWLPLAEYRYLAAIAECAKRDGSSSEWNIPTSIVDEASSALSTRLGFVVIRDPEPEPADHVAASVHERPDVARVSTEVYLERLPPLSVRAQRIIDTYSLRTVSDLRRWMSSEDCKVVPNFGRRSRAELQVLLERFPADSVNNDGVHGGDPEQTTPRDPMHEVDMQYGKLGVECLGRLPARVRRIIEEESLHTISQLISWLRRADATRVANYGRRTHRDALARIDELGRCGPTQLVFGCDSPPTTAEGLYASYLATLDEDARAIFTSYYGDGRTLEEVGRSRNPPVTRERIRQIIESNLEADIPSWRSTALAIFAPALARLEEGAGVALFDRCLALTGATRQEHLELLAKLAVQSISVPDAGHRGVVTTLSNDEFLLLREEIAVDVDEIVANGGKYKDIVEHLMAWGIRLSEADGKGFVEAMVGIHFKDDAAYSNRARVRALYVDCLRSSGRAMSADEVAGIVRATSPETLATPRNVVANFGRSLDVYNIGKGHWIHGDHLGITRPELKALTESCLKLVPRGGAAVNVTHLLRELERENPMAKTVSPYAVRDEMIHSGKVRGWRVGCDVAWRAGDVSRVSIAEWIQLVAEMLEQPFQLAELVSRVAEVSGSTEGSVSVQAMRDPSLLVLGNGEYMLGGYAFEDEITLLRARDAVVSLIPLDDVVSRHELASRLDMAALSARTTDTRVLWALARTADGIESRIRGHLLWRTSLGTDAWLALRNGRKFGLAPVFTTHDLSEWLRTAHSVDSVSLAYVLVQEAVESGRALACGRGWYLDMLAGTDRVESAIDRTPELERLVRCDQDFVRDSPARDLLNASRRRRGLFEVWDG
jgi:hypothetical protein